MLAPFHLEIMLIFTQDRCTIYAKRTIGSEIVLDAPDRTPWSHESCGIPFRSISSQCWKHDSVCLEIVLLLTQDGCMVCVERTAGSDVV
jgi:hypothetical protein